MSRSGAARLPSARRKLADTALEPLGAADDGAKLVDAGAEALLHVAEQEDGGRRREADDRADASLHFSQTWISTTRLRR